MATAKKTNLSRDETLVRASKFRAAILAHVRAHPEVNTLEIMAHMQEMIKKEKASENLVHGQLKQLVDSGQLLTNPGHRPLRYTLANHKPAPAVVVKGKKGATANFTIDIVKATGRVRLQFADLSIDIGVI